VVPLPGSIELWNELTRKKEPSYRGEVLVMCHLLIEAQQVNARIAWMKLNESDAAIIQHLRRREESWILTRWATLFVGILMLCGSAFTFERIWSTVAYDQILIILCVLVAPASAIVLFIALAAILYVLAFWNGRPTNKLWLRLADEIESQK